jgi:hypothetical protein
MRQSVVSPNANLFFFPFKFFFAIKPLDIVLQKKVCASALRWFIDFFRQQLM